MKKIVVSCNKGGSGKTTIATTLAGMLAIRGYKTLLVDFDPQGSAAYLLGGQPSPGVFEVMQGYRDILDLVVPVPAEVYVPPEMERHPEGQLYFLPGNKATHAIVETVSNVATLNNAIDELAEDVDIDFVFIDTVPSPGALITYAYRAAEYVLIPAKMEKLHVAGIMDTLDAISAWDNLQLLGIIPTMVKSKTTLHQYNINQFVEAGYPVWSPIPERIIWGEASEVGKLVYCLPGNTGKTRRDAVRLAEQFERVIANATR